MIPLCNVGNLMLHARLLAVVRSQNTLNVSVRVKSFYVTTPIYYVNSVPHIGHLYTTTLADVSCRWHNFRNGATTARLLTGTDEHGLKVMQAAQMKKTGTMQYCDQVSKKFKDMCDLFEISMFDFIRTTEQRHLAAVQAFWNAIAAKGFIYKGVYEGWYSTSDETFVPESNVLQEVDKRTGEKIHLCKDTLNRLEWTKENNYMFRLSDLTDRVRQWISDNPKVVYPDKFRKLVLESLKEPYTDLSVSRESFRVPWGISVPGDPGQTIYVWLDALVNYLAAAGYPDTNSAKFRDMWPADIHFVGMDIIKFHAVYWPAFLIAAGLELPKQIVVHSHWTYEHMKMSKSKGNIVDPFEMAGKVSAEGLKYFLLRQSTLDNNSSYSELLLYRALNSDLANDLGNLLNRGVAKTLNPSQKYPAFHKDIFHQKSNTVANDDYSMVQMYIEQVRNLPSTVDALVEKFRFYQAIFEIMEMVRRSNFIIHHYELWLLDKDNAEQLLVLETLLHCVYEGLRVSAILLQPMIPTLADTVLSKLGVPSTSRRWSDAEASFKVLDGLSDPLVGQPLGTRKTLLFKKLKIPDRLLQEEQSILAT